MTNLTCSQEEINEVLERIRTAQENRDSYKKALMEISSGQKRSHWIWWIWPAHARVRSTSRPSFSLPSFAAAQAYLKEPTLCSRLVKITKVATEKLHDGIVPSKLFGSSTDACKFYETTTLFAAAACLARNKNEEVAVFTAAVKAIQHEGVLHKETLSIIQEESGISFGPTASSLLSCS